MFQRGLQLLDIRREILIKEIFVTEIHDEDLIVGIARTHQVQRGFVDLLALFPHGSGIVDHNAHCNRVIFHLELPNLLRLTVFEDSEVRLGKRSNQPVSVIHHSRVQNNLACFRPEDKSAVVGRTRPLCLALIRGGCLSWWGLSSGGLLPIGCLPCRSRLTPLGWSLGSRSLPSAGRRRL